MRPADHHNSPLPLPSFRRPILSFKNDQVHSMDTNLGSCTWNAELELFQKRVSNRFRDLLAATAEEFLSVSWMRKLLDSFLACLEEFRVILLNNKEKISKPPLDKLISDFFEKSIKALDICNATRDGIEKVRLWQKHLEIVICALGSRQRTIAESQIRRARKALMDLALIMLDEKESGSVFSQRNRSFGRQNAAKDSRRQPGHSRSLSWSVSRNWSAVKQLQSLANNLVPPRGNEISATDGLIVPVFTMSYVLMFVLWALVAAIPCQDRGLQIHFSVPKQYSWGTPMLSLHDRIMEDSKKRDRRSSNGLLKEICQIEKCTNHMSDLVDSAQFPMSEAQKEEVEQGVLELTQVLEACKSGIDPLEREVREVFRKIMSCRTEGLEHLNRRNSSG